MTRVWGTHDTPFLSTGLYGTRDILLIDLYRAALYLPHRTSDMRYIHDPRVPKAFRLQIVYSGDKPDQLPRAWREKLLPVLQGSQVERLRHAYAVCQPGDLISIHYIPAVGTRVWWRDRLLIAQDGHELMRAFLDLWLGDSPVSDTLRYALLSPEE